MNQQRSPLEKRNALEGEKAGMLRVDRVGDRRSYAILARNFLVENSTNKKLTKFREHLSKSR
jgi:hypothetical protein